MKSRHNCGCLTVKKTWLYSLSLVNKPLNTKKRSYNWEWHPIAFWRGYIHYRFVSRLSDFKNITLKKFSQRDWRASFSCKPRQKVLLWLVMKSMQSCAGLDLILPQSVLTIFCGCQYISISIRLFERIFICVKQKAKTEYKHWTRTLTWT